MGGVVFVWTGDEDGVDEGGGAEVFCVESGLGDMFWDFLQAMGEGGGGDVGEEGDFEEGG